MALIAKQTKTERDTLSLRLDRDVNLTLKQYSEFVSSSQDYVINQALRYFFKRDKEFAAWQVSQPEAGASAEGATPPGAPDGRAPRGTKQRAAETA